MFTQTGSYGTDQFCPPISLGDRDLVFPGNGDVACVVLTDVYFCTLGWLPPDT